MTARQRTLLVMAGGTGGHIMPGLAIADFVRDRGWQVVWMGNPDGMEAKIVPQRGYRLAPVRFAALRGKGLLRKLLLPLALLSGFAQALKQIRRIRPDAVIGLGGYVSFPGGMMAVLLGRPFVVHEQNSVAGLANRVLAKVADRVFCGFPEAIAGSVWSGNPVRAEIAAVPAPAERFGGRSGPLRLLVVGGSLGAAALNDAVPRALAIVPAEQRPLVRHQAGAKHLDALRANYAAAGVAAECAAFIDDMAAAYATADFVICRAGALTVAELSAAGVASVLVPFPHAVDDHQTGNAKFLAETGAAVLLPQGELNPARLAALIAEFERPRLLDMACRARALARPEATQTVAGACIELGERAAA